MSDLELIRHGAVLQFQFNRPQKKNALTAAMYETMIASIAQADAGDDIRAIVFSGAGEIFTAGNDISDFLSMGQRADTAPAPLRFIRALALCQTPMLAAVDGLAIGIGTTLLLHCDLVYATARSRLRMPFVELALVPEAGSSVLLPARIGMARASELLLLCEEINGQKAFEWGLVNNLVDADGVLATTLEQAARLAKQPKEALAATRRLLRPNVDEVLATIDRESLAFMQRIASAEARETFMRFMARKHEANGG